MHTHAAETCIGNRPQETSVTIAAKTPYPQHLTKDPLAGRPRTTTPTTTTSVIIDTKTPYPQDLIKDATTRRPRAKTPTTTTRLTPSTPTMTTPSTTQRRPTSSSSFHLTNPQPRHKPEPTWKTLKMLRKKKRGTRYPSTTGKTQSTSPPTLRTTTHLLPHPSSSGSSALGLSLRAWHLSLAPRWQRCCSRHFPPLPPRDQQHTHGSARRAAIRTCP